MAVSDTLIRASEQDNEALAPKQAHLIRSAYKVMGEKGLGHLSLQDVADEAGVSKAILPYYFDSKENLTFLGYAARNDRFADVGATFHEICNGLYAEVIRLGQEEGVFPGRDASEDATVVRALIDGLFTQWIQDKDWKKKHAECRELCKRSVLTYLTAGP